MKKSNPDKSIFKEYFGKTKLTYFLISLCMFVFVAENLLSYMYGAEYLDKLITIYGFSLSGLIEGNYWSFFTAIFLHANAEHLILNMLALFFFGAAVEEALGWKKTLLIFLSAGIVGELTILAGNIIGVMPADIPTIGASAAIFGLLGTGMMVKPFHIVLYRYLIPLPLILVAVLYSIYNVLELVASLTIGVSSEIAYIAHLGGLLFGVAMGFREEGEKKGLLMIGLIILILVLIPFVWSYVQILESSVVSSMFRLNA